MENRENNEIRPQKKICASDEYYSEIKELCDGVTEAKFYPDEGEDFWRCACGRKNVQSEKNCENCGASRDKLRIIFSDLFLMQKRSENIARKRASEYKRMQEDAEKWQKIDPEVERIYLSAQNFEETRDNYIKAAETLEKISGYKNSASLAKEYRELAVTAPIYDKRTLKSIRNKRIKKISLVCVIILSAVMVIYGALYFTVIAPGGMRYEIDENGEVKITSYDDFFGGKRAEIPEELFGKKVTAIDNEAFADSKALVSVKIPNTVTKIGTNAFKNCVSLETVSVPDSVTEFGSGVFFGCDKLEKAEINAKVDIIAMNTFYGCASLERVTLNMPLTRIDTNAFLKCDSMKVVEFSGSYEEWNSIHINGGNNVIKKAAVICDYVPKDK